MTKPPEEGKPAAASPVADAALVRRGRQRNALAHDLEAIEASLVAEIEAFDLKAITPPAEEPPASLLGRSFNTPPLPEIVPEGTLRPHAGQSTTAAPPAPAAAVPKGSGLLDQLRQQAQARQHDDEARERELGAAMKQLDGCLRLIFSYCHELVQQLNIVKPVVNRRYTLLGSIEFEGLQWEEGFADYRTRAQSAGAIYETVTLSARLLAPRTVDIERDGIAVESFRKALFDSGIAFTCKEFRNERRLVEKAVFSITAEVKLNLRWRADVERGVIVLETRNLERFGSRDYILAPEAATPAMLDQFARLLLDQPNSFRDFYRL